MKIEKKITPNYNLKSKVVIGTVLGASILSIAAFGGGGNNTQQTKNTPQIVQELKIDEKTKSQLADLEKKKTELEQSQKLEKEKTEKLKIENERIQKENDELRQKEEALKIENEKAKQAKAAAEAQAQAAAQAATQAVNNAPQVNKTPTSKAPATGSFGYCADGTTTNSKGKSGACSHHGGLAR
jgi:chromosome segregation ATPase